jgi:hypothetical protein
MTSNFKRTLQAGLAVVVVVWSAAEARADEEPGAPEHAPAAPAASAEPAATVAFAGGSDWLLSVDNLFGYTYAHQSNNFHASSFTLLGDAAGTLKSPYRYPGLALDLVLKSALTVGVEANFVRMTASGGFNNTGFEAQLRLGYAMMLGPWLGVWPRLGVTYSHATTVSALGVTVDALLVIEVNPHLLVTFGPVADIGVSGTLKSNGATTDVKFTDVGAYAGLTLPL